MAQKKNNEAYGGGGNHLQSFLHPHFINTTFSISQLDLSDQLVLNYTDTDTSGLGGTNLIYFDKSYRSTYDTFKDYIDSNLDGLQDSVYEAKSNNIKPFIDYYPCKRYFEVTIRPANGSKDLGTGSSTVEPYRSSVCIAFCTDYPSIDNMNSQYGITLDNSPYQGGGYCYAVSMYESSNISLAPSFVVDPTIGDYDANSDHNITTLESYTIGIGFMVSGEYQNKNNNNVFVYNQDVDNFMSALVNYTYTMGLNRGVGTNILKSCYLGVTAINVGQSMTSFAPCKVQIEFNFGTKPWKYPNTANQFI